MEEDTTTGAVTPPSKIPSVIIKGQVRAGLSEMYALLESQAPHTPAWWTEWFGVHLNALFAQYFDEGYVYAWEQIKIKLLSITSAYAKLSVLSVYNQNKVGVMGDIVVLFEQVTALDLTPAEGAEE